MPRHSALRSAILLFVFSLAGAAAAHAQAPVRSHAILVGGLGGEAAYAEAYRGYLLETRRALVDRFGFRPEDVVVLAESDEPGFVAGVSTAEAIREAFEATARRAGTDDHVYVVLFGHGSYDGTNASLNIPRRDLTDADFGALVDALPAARVVFVNAASASGPFVEHLAGEGRVVVTATRAGTQRNRTVFPEYLVEALTTPAADLDKDGRLSVREWFVYAARETERSFEAQNLLASEHALLADAAGSEGARLAEVEAGQAGHLAAVTYLGRGRGPTQDPAAAAADPALVREREAIELEIAEVKRRKSALVEDVYYAELETLFVRLARLNERIDGPGR